jgi:hypothetical protein
VVGLTIRAAANRFMSTSFGRRTLSPAVLGHRIKRPSRPVNCLAGPPAYRQPDAPGRTEVALTIGASLFLIAVGAILKFAVTWTLVGLDLHVAGVVLMVVGAVGLVLGLLLLFWNRSSGVGPPPPAL